MEDRPAPAPEKLRRQFQDWVDGTELPGRTVSYLKTGFLDELLDQRPDSDAKATMQAAWAEWEAGTTTPAHVLEVLRDQGVDDMLAELADATAG